MSSSTATLEIHSDQKSTSAIPFAYPDIHEVHSEFFHENGYLVVEDAISPEEVEQLRRETLRICRGELGEMPGAPPTSPHDSDEEVLKRVLCLHMPHKISPLMRSFISHRTIVEVLTRIIGPNVKAMQSMLFIKAAGKPGQAWHQDEDYIPTRDRSLTGAWIAMDNATVENGCLWVIPGSHRHSVLWPMHWHGDRRFDCAHESYDFLYKDENSVPVEVRTGAIVFFNGYLLHRSLPNHAKSGYRRCLVNHYMSAESLLPWGRLKENEGVAKADYRDIIMVAGKDPYAYKGIEDLSRPGIRPSGEGGCGSWGDQKYKDEE